MSVVVLKPGLLTTLQDRGRSGFAALGVGRAGPLDDVAFRLANALVGNGDEEAALEFTVSGPRLRFDTDATIALVGAAFDARLGARDLPGWQAVRVAAGDVLDCARVRHGARAYLAISGGFAVASVLGSRATDVNTGIGALGGRALQAGDVLPIVQRRDARTPPSAQPWSLDPRPWFDPAPSHPIHLIRGHHFDALDEVSREALFAAQFRISSDSNRVGFRLDGARLALAGPLELVSEAVAFGTVQLPAGGQPIVLMAEHPTIGGYPRIGQVAAIDLPRLAQRKPGDPLRFREIGLDDAQTRYLQRERELARLLEAITARLHA